MMTNRLKGRKSMGEAPMQPLLEIWREIGSQPRLVDAIPRITDHVAGQLPIGALLVRRLDLSSFQLVTVACGTTPEGREPEHVRGELAPDRVEELVAWCRLGRVLRIEAGSRHPVALAALPEAVGDAALIAPLSDGSGPAGLLVLLASPGRELTAGHERLAAELVEPFEAALRNDGRIEKLERLRRAMEADKSALLSRLQRQDIADTIIGAETGLKPVIEQVIQVAPTDAPVLILGETGTGKEVIAREIHAHSRRADGPLFRVNCGAIPPDLVDSELFGHERGAFTGAVGARKGWFERADGGTLFLDEIGELPLAAQVRMLRVIQEGVLDRVGGSRTLSVDVRVVAATNADLAEMVARGTFREDLWYRISVFPIRLPLLRERLGDIPVLAAHFAGRAGRRLGGGPLLPSPEDLHLLLSYPWPGNVRELAAVIERAAILGNGKRLMIAEALGSARPAPPAPPAPPAAEPAAAAVQRPAETGPVATLDEATVRHIEAALRRTHGRVEGPFGAAVLLGINPNTLRGRMRRLRVDPRRFRVGPG
jgi:transcriptional regulator with GAF, ATPase, and Fis domain